MAQSILDQLLPVAEEHGIPIALEPTCRNEISGSCHSHSLADTAELINQYDSEFLGLNVDLFHVGNEFLDLSSSWFGKYVRLIQVSDFDDRNGVRQRTQIGSGKVDWKAFCSYIDQTQYDGVFEFEMFGESFDLESYEQSLHRVAEGLFAPISEPAEFESVKA